MLTVADKDIYGSSAESKLPFRLKEKGEERRSDFHRDDWFPAFSDIPFLILIGAGGRQFD